MTLSVPLDHVVPFGLAMLRLLGIFLFAPLFGHAHLPIRMRVGAAFLVAWAGSVHWLGNAEVWQTGPLWLTAAGELVLGASLGLAASLVFSGFSLMAELASIQGGLGAATVLDPTSGVSSVALISLTQAGAMLVFLAIDGHHEVLRAAMSSFERIPPGVPADFGSVAAAGGIIFDVALRLAAPFIGVLTVVNVAVGVLGRIIPQLNLMSLQLPATIAVLMLVFAVGAVGLTEAMASAITRALDETFSMLLGAG